jgi:NAD(P)-dependent dehydrogenase (short-subunit alcohol dehydrogenase family)
MLLKHKIAVVTGAANGLGLATARRFAKEGATLALLDLEKQALQEAHETLASEGTRVFSRVIDLLD